MAGGGVGEAMLIGAAVGAGTGGIMSAVQDKDPLEGALLGAAMGAAGGGIGSGIGGLASGASSGAGAGAASGSGAGAAGSAGAAGVSSGAGSQAATLAAQNAGMGLTGAEQTAALLGTTNAQAGSQAATLAAQNAGMGLTPAESAANIISSTTPGTTSFAGANPTSWGAQGLGQGLAPGLTNAQAYGAGAGGGIMGLVGASNQQEQWAPEEEPYSGSLSYFKYNPQTFKPSVAPGYADGGIATLGPQTGMYPQSQIPDRTQFAVPSQMPTSRNVINSDYDTRIDPYTGDIVMASGGISSLGHYSDGGRMLRGPGDGMSDDIPGVIAGKQPARLADGEFVVPADVVSHLGNGSTDAGAKKLYSMMDNVRKARTGSKKQGRQIKAEKHMPGMASGGIAHFADGGFSEYSSASVDQSPYSEDTPAWFSNWLASQETTPRPGTGNVSPQFQSIGFDPNYYNLGYYQNQMPGTEWEIADATKQLGNLQSVKGFDPNWYLSQYPDIAADRYWSQNPFQHYQEYGIKEGRSPYEGGQAGVQLQDTAAIAEQQARIDRANDYLGDLQSNIGRLENSAVRYDPYTVSSRPSSNEPQFYGNIYRPTYENFASPGYDLGAGAGRWNNIASTQFNEPAYLQQKIQQLQDTGYQGDFTGTTGAQLKDYMQNVHELTPQQHYQLYGRHEGLNPYVGSNNPAGTPTLARDMAAAAQQAQAPKAEQKPEEGKRRGGIASLVK